jgi:hypothetical protein
VNDTGAPGPDPHYGQGILNIARIEERNVPGIYDMALAGFHIADSDTLQVSAQNRGTEAVDGVSMVVTIDGERHDFELGEFGVGETISRELPIVLTESATVDLRARVEVAGEMDANAANDKRGLSIENGAE